MGWSGIEAIPLLPGESRRDAVDRVYSDGWVLEADENGPTLTPVGGPERDHTRVSRSQRQWMVDAVGILEELQPGWSVVSQYQEPDRRWPWCLDLENPGAPMLVELVPEVATFRYASTELSDDDEWKFWWRTIKRFTRIPSVIFHPDESEMIAGSLSATEAWRRYNWF